MIPFTVEFLTSWQLEGYTHIIYREWGTGCVTLCPSKEELPVHLRILLCCDCFPIYSPIIQDVARQDISYSIGYYISENYDHYRNFDSEHIDMEAEF